MNKRLTAFALILCAALGSVFAAQTNNDEYLTKLAGAWQGEGKFYGLNAKETMKWETALDGKFMRLSVRYDFKTPDGKAQSFDGIAYYKALGNGQYQAEWFDSQGKQYPVKAQLENGELVAWWGGEKVKGKSTYRLTNDGKLEISDSSQQKDGSWKEFSRFTLNRQ